jgi:hypothetical protein
MDKSDIDSIKNVNARRRLQQALGYKRGMDELVEKQPDSIKDKLQQYMGDIADWLDLMLRLAKAIDTFEGNEVIHRARH